MVAPSTEDQLVLERTIAAPPELVFDMWTDAEHIARWFGPSADINTTVHEAEVREGGQYRIQFDTPDGKVHIVRGTYDTVRRPEQLAFSWAWEAPNDYADHDTHVTIDLSAVDGGTRLVLTHVRFADDAMRIDHNQGWSGCLDRLVAESEKM